MYRISLTSCAASVNKGVVRMEFGERLRNMRKHAGLTQAELGNLIGKSDRVVGYYEANVRFPKDPKTLIKLSDMFNVSVDYMVGNNREFNHEPNGNIVHMQAKELLEDVKSLFADDKLSKGDRDEFFRMVCSIYFKAINI